MQQAKRLADLTSRNLRREMLEFSPGGELPFFVFISKISIHPPIPWHGSNKVAGREQPWPVTAEAQTPWDRHENPETKVFRGHPKRGRLKPTLPKNGLNVTDSWNAPFRAGINTRRYVEFAR